MPAPDDVRPVEYLGGPVRRLFMRYPWHVGAFVGIALITGLRPCTRHVPEPPPVVAPMPAFELLGAGGATVTNDALEGHVWIAGFVCVDCDGPGAPVGPSLHEIAERARTHDKPMRFLAIGVRADRDTPEAMARWANGSRWLALGGAQGAMSGLRTGVVRALGGTSETWSRLFIIDDRGNLRGSYALGERGADEIYHRAQHVARESRARRRATKEAR
jgi:cytochrome oxidase Cu insertion factor (SCO1/SenC/PrrC family)